MDVPCGTPNPFLWLLVADRAGACGYVNAFAFEAVALCSRAVQTTILYGPRETSAPAAAATGNASSAATYAAGSPWWRAPVRIASR